MDWMKIWDEIWKSTLLILSGMVLLRLAGRKSISQMTVPTTVIMISMGTIIVQPIANKSVWMALIAASIFVLILLAVEKLQLKWNGFERLFRSKAVMVIRDGKLLPDNLKKINMSVDQLEMKLRQAGISRLDDIKSATVEANGQLGYELSDESKPVTVKQLRELLSEYFPKGQVETQTQSVVKARPLRPESGAEMSLFDEPRMGEKQQAESRLH